MQIDAIGEPPLMVGSRAHAALRNVTVVVALLEALDAILEGGRGPELLLDDLAGLIERSLVPKLGQDNEPRSQRHQNQDDEGRSAHDVTVHPKWYQTIGVSGGGGDGCGSGCGFHDFPLLHHPRQAKLADQLLSRANGSKRRRELLTR